MKKNKYKKAYDRMARYIENTEGCCPAASGYPLEKDNCLSCIGECIDRRNEGYNKELSVQCWKGIFMEDVTEQEFEKILNETGMESKEIKISQPGTRLGSWTRYAAGTLQLKNPAIPVKN